MASEKFDQFALIPSPDGADFLAGYKADGSINIRVTVAGLAAQISSILGLGALATQNAVSLANNSQVTGLLNLATQTSGTINLATQTSGQISLATQVTSNLPIANLNNGTGANASTFWRGDDTWATPPSASGAIVTGSSGATISGMQSSPDVDKTGPNDDNFTENTSGIPAGWTTVTGGTPDTIDTNTSYSQLHMVANGGGGTNALKGIIQNVPSFPFTVTTKLTDWTPGGMGSTTGYGQNAAGLFLSVAGGAGANLAFQAFFNSSYYFDLAVRLASSRTNVTNNIYDAGAHYSGRPPIYLRYVVASASSLTAWMSYGGIDFTQVPLASSLNAYNPGFSVATVGLFVDGSSGATGSTVHFDWIQFT